MGKKTRTTLLSGHSERFVYVCWPNTATTGKKFGMARLFRYQGGGG
jgi:hypothetical protein